MCLVRMLTCSVFERRNVWDYDLHKILDSFAFEKPKPSVLLKVEDVVSCCEFVPRPKRIMRC